MTSPSTPAASSLPAASRYGRGSSRLLSLALSLAFCDRKLNVQRKLREKHQKMIFLRQISFLIISVDFLSETTAKASDPGQSINRRENRL